MLESMGHFVDRLASVFERPDVQGRFLGLFGNAGSIDDDVVLPEGGHQTMEAFVLAQGSQRGVRMLRDYRARLLALRNEDVRAMNGAA